MLHTSGTGVSTYACMLGQAQARLSHLTGTLVATPSRLPPWLCALGPRSRRSNFAARTGSGPYQLCAPDIFRRAHTHFGLTGRLLEVRPSIPYGIMHWTYPIPLVMAGWLNVYAVHDAIPITHPELSPISGRRLERTLREIAKVADAVTTISAASRETLAGLGIFRADRLFNSSLAIDSACSDQAEIERAVMEAGLVRGQYLLFVGSVERRKNVHRLVAAYGRSRRTMPLVIAGPATPDGQDIEAQIASTPNVIRLPYQPRSTLEAIIAGARALVFPSLAEGFGLPVIEAMARGTAVLASNIPAIAEVAGTAALLIEPTCEDSLSNALDRLAHDHELIATLEHHGRRRAALYTVDAFAGKLSRIYQDVLAASGAGATALIQA